MLPDMFKSLEKDLIRKIREGDAPFLGLFADDFGSHVRKFLNQRLTKDRSPVEAFIRGISEFPAIFASYLIIHVMEGYGDGGHFEVYSYIHQAIGAQTSQPQREKLWRQFRTACQRLGLAVSPKTSGTHYMVDEYLLQAGFPLQYVPDLVKRMLRLAGDVGVPDDDDPDSIYLWQQNLLERLNVPFSTIAREAIERDDKSYYVRVFLKQLQSPADNGGVVEQKIREAIEVAHRPSFPTQKLSIPQLLYRDMQLGVFLPGGHENSWEVNVDGEVTSFKSHEGDRFIPFDSELPSRVEVNGPTISLKRVLWEDERNNRLIIFFHPTGRLCRSASLVDKEVALAPGQYVLLSRFEPEGVEESVELVSEAPSLYVMMIRLLPGEKKCLRRGPAELLLLADSVPTLNWAGTALRGLRGTELYPSNGLKLDIFLPEEMLSLGGIAYEVVLKPGSLGEETICQISPDDEGKACLDLGVTGSEWNPGVARLLAELRRRGTRRVLARSAILLWNGLDHLGKSVFHCLKLPGNLNENLCENVVVSGEKKRITYQDDIHRFFRIVFMDGGKQHSFTWPVPGVFLSLEEPGENTTERAIKVGSTLAVNSSSRSVLKVYCTQPAVLELGTFRSMTDFPRVGSKRLPMASLMEYVRPECNTLLLKYEGSDVPCRLIELVSPHTVTIFTQTSRMDSHDIQLKLQSPLQSITITAEDIISGEKSTLEFPINDVEQYVTKDLTVGGRMTVLSLGDCSYGIYLALNGMMPGFWLLDFQAKIGGRWGLLADRSGNTYSDLLLVSQLGHRAVFSDVYHGQIETLGSDRLEAMLARVHRRLLLRHAPECFTLVSSLFKVWSRLFQTLKHQSSIGYFASLFAERPPQEVASPWIPGHNVGASFPQIFCYSKEKYADLRKQRDNVLLDCLRNFPMLRDLPKVFQNGTMDTAVVSGFSNFPQIIGGAQPKGFDLERYQQALKERDLAERWFLLNDDDWRPGKGDYLGPMHYRYATCQIRENFNRTLPENNQRRGKSLALLRRLRSFSLSKFCPVALPVGVADGVDLIRFRSEINNCSLLSEEDELQNQVLQAMERFLSLFAQICRCEPRHSGVLERFLREMKERMELTDPGEIEKDLRRVLAYLLSIGEELFAFYLLLWELVFAADLDIYKDEKCQKIIR